MHGRMKSPKESVVEAVHTNNAHAAPLDGTVKRVVGVGVGLDLVGIRGFGGRDMQTGKVCAARRQMERIIIIINGLER